MSIFISKQDKCLECDKIRVYCKSLCQYCYQKKSRNTPENKLKRKLYYETVIKQKCLDNRLKKKPREPKEKKLCECGKISIVKNMCRNCYQNKRNNPNYIYKPKKIKPQKIKLVDVTDKLDLSIKIGKGNTGKYFHKARFGQSETKLFATKEISEYLKYNSDFGNYCYLAYESQVLTLKDYYDCEIISIDMNKIYKY